MWPQNKCRSLWPYFMVQWFLPYILKTVWYMNTILWDYESVTYNPMFDLKIFVGHCDLYFIVQWFCLISWRLFDLWTSYFWIMSQYNPTCDLKINVGHWPYFMVQWFLPYILKTIWYMNTILWDYESVWPDVWPQNICRPLWPIFHSPVILPYILKTIQYFGNMSQYDPTCDLKIFVGDCDIYFMVH